MAKPKHKVFPKEGESKLKEANRNLRARVKQMKREIVNLKQQIKELQKGFDKNNDHVKKVTDFLSLEQNIQLANDKVPKTKTETLKEELRRQYCGKAETED